MKIGFIGNTNNYPFMLALALARMGHEIIFVVDSKERLHRPEYYVGHNNLSGIKIIDHADVIKKFYQFLFWSDDFRKIKTELSQCDGLIVNGIWPVFAKKLNRPYFVLLTGSDLEYYADPICVMKDIWKSSKKLYLWKKIIRVCLATIVSHQQLKAIKGGIAYNYFPKGIVPNGDRLLAKIRTKSKRFGFMMTDVSRINVAPLPLNTTPKVLLAARHSWVYPMREGTSALDYKGTDIFLKGVAKFKKDIGKPLQVTLVRKGPDVSASEALIKELGIEEMVIWHNEMSQADLYKEYLKSDIIVDQLDQGMVGMVGLDAMAMGRPLIANGRPEIWEPLFGVPSPICQATNPDEVCEQLNFLYDPKIREEVSKKSRIYVEEYFSSTAAAKICAEVLKNA